MRGDRGWGSLSVISCQLSDGQKRRSDEATKRRRRGGRRLGRDQPGLRTGIEATAGASRHGYAAGNIAFATKGIGSGIVMRPAPPAGRTRAAEFDNFVGRGFARQNSPPHNRSGGRGSLNLRERLPFVPRSMERSAQGLSDRDPTLRQRAPSVQRILPDTFSQFFPVRSQIRRNPTPARTSVSAKTVPSAPQPKSTTFDFISRRWASSPNCSQRTCRE